MGLPESLQRVRHHFQDDNAGDKAFVKLLSYIPKTSMEAVQIACQKALDHRTISCDVILNYLLRGQEDPYEERLPEIPQHLALKCKPISNCARYNIFLIHALAS